MGDFVQTGNAKTSVRELATPIATVTAFDAIVQGVLDDNPFLCTEFTEEGVTVPGVARNRESYTVRINYENTEGDRVGSVSARAPTVAAFTTIAANILGDTDLATAMGGTPVRDSARDSFSCQLRCHDASGELYMVTFTRNRVRISSYEDDAIRTRVETWADTISELA